MNLPCSSLCAPLLATLPNMYKLYKPRSSVCVLQVQIVKALAITQTSAHSEGY